MLRIRSRQIIIAVHAFAADNNDIPREEIATFMKKGMQHRWPD
ncbi:MAG TPA: hypothetical protein VLT36_22800 [Candidatus Dormibacteraeota bacterium]|nr:hypothetical protein [Candidatus Dormibacteraeota bacterium]